jgi:hypothetical protein
MTRPSLRVLGTFGAARWRFAEPTGCPAAASCHRCSATRGRGAGWAIGSYHAWDPDSGDTVQLIVTTTGSVVLRNEAGTIVNQGDLRDGMVYWRNGKKSWLAAEGPGVMLGDSTPASTTTSAATPDPLPHGRRSREGTLKRLRGDLRGVVVGSLRCHDDVAADDVRAGEPGDPSTRARWARPGRAGPRANAGPRPSTPKLVGRALDHFAPWRRGCHRLTS